MNESEIIRLIGELANAVGYDMVKRYKLPAKKKVMPTGIKRPGPKLNYEDFKLQLRVKENLKKVGDFFELVVPPGYPKNKFQSAMINAALSVFKKRGMVRTSSVRYPKTAGLPTRVVIRMTRIV